MKAIINGRILMPDQEIQGKALLYDDKIIGLADPKDVQADEIIDARGMYVAPGLVDTHIHGYQGADVSDANPQGVRNMAKGLMENGVTSFLPTTLTVDWATMEEICDQLRHLRQESLKPDFDGAEILGMHMEGPFINPGKKGAQNENYILKPDAEKVLPLADIIRVITCAPEMEGGDAFVATLKKETDIRLSIGHTGANFDQARKAFQLGVTRSTHTFNAMTPLLHRDPGVVGAALTDDNVYCELIPDTFHVHPGLFTMMHRIKGDHLVLITDALRSAGMPDGEYENGGQTFVLRGIECRLLDGTIAGSVLRFNHGVRNLRDHARIPMHLAVRAATLNAAESAGVEAAKGSLAPGKDADIILMDDQCEVYRTIVRGVCKYER